MRRKCARRDDLNLSKSKKCSAKKIRTGVWKQLQYIIRDIGFIADMVRNNGAKLSNDAFNEATDFFSAVEGYRRDHGFYPARVLADKIYRNREILSWYKERNIQMTGPALGRPPKNQDKRRETRRQEYQDICDRNIVEGEFGVGKRSFGLNRIMAHLPETSFCVIGVALLCMNLAKSLKELLLALAEMLIAWCSWDQNEKFQLVAE